MSIEERVGPPEHRARGQSGIAEQALHDAYVTRKAAAIKPADGSPKVLLAVLVVSTVSRRLCPVRSGVLTVMLGCAAVFRGTLPVAFGGSSVAAGLEAVFLYVGQSGLGAVERLDQVCPVRGRCVAVPSAHRPVGGGIGPVPCVLGTGGAAGLRRGVTFLGPAVTLLGPQVAPV